MSLSNYRVETITRLGILFYEAIYNRIDILNCFTIQIDEQTKKERLHFLEEIAHRRAMEWVEKTILGRVSHMLVEESSGGKSYGYTEHYLYAEVNGEYGENTFVSFVPSRLWLHQQAVAVKE